ncbi:MAG: thioredoxin [Oscillospiraceae bacterium]
MIITLTEENFEAEVLNAVAPVLVDFWAPWCTPCQMMGPVIDEVSDIATGVKVCKLNIEEFKKLAIKYKVASIPTVVLFKNGSEEKRLVGLSQKEEVLKFIG